VPSTGIGQSNSRVIEYAACFARASGQDRRQATPGASVIPVYSSGLPVASTGRYAQKRSEGGV